MSAPGAEGPVLVTGASGQVGRQVCALLRATGANVLAIDLEADSAQQVVPCDLCCREHLAGLFQSHPIRAVIHLAAILPTAFRTDPLRGARVNLTASCELLQEAVNHQVARFVFASSMSVYGSSPRSCPVNEDSPVAPDDPYGACKWAVESVGEVLAQNHVLEFVTLRIARVIGPGAKNTSSPWRSQILGDKPTTASISIPFAPGAQLSLVHTQDVARMLVILAGASEVRHWVYNTPAEIWEAKQLQEVIREKTTMLVELGQEANAGPACDGSRFAREFSFPIRGLAERLAGGLPAAPE